LAYNLADEVENELKLYETRRLLMEIRIVDRNVNMTELQRDLLERNVQFAFDRFETQTRSIDVLLSDINGPRGGEDIQCRVKVQLNGKGEIHVEGRGASLETVVADAMDRVSVAVARRLERLKESQGTSMSG